VDEALMDAARELRVRVIPWTVNAAAEARRLAAMGVHGVCTDDVRLLANL
jgi:glycerophosphoryl diester phosphodiesterase